jgi:hypothetical protein
MVVDVSRNDAVDGGIDLFDISAIRCASVCVFFVLLPNTLPYTLDITPRFSFGFPADGVSDISVLLLLVFFSPKK